jgi:hypothetical protein
LKCSISIGAFIGNGATCAFRRTSACHCPPQPLSGRPHSSQPAASDARPEAYDVLLDHFIPASILVNEQRRLVHTFAGGGEFLRHPDGRASSDILEIG